MLDYETLKIAWWVLIGALLIGFAVTDGFDMGVTSLLKVVGKTDNQRRVMLNTIGPHWDGNQVWFITAGGAIFAAWPLVYATAFSGLYWALFLVLFALFFRPVGFEYRSKIQCHQWRSLWDWGLTIGGAVPALVFGVAFGNLFQGVPFEFNTMMHSTYTGSFWQLLNPFGLFCGVISLGMLIMHGATWLMMRTENIVYSRSRCIAIRLPLIVLVLFIIGGIWVNFGIDGYIMSTTHDLNTAMSPFDKNVSLIRGGWLTNYMQYPALFLIPLIGLLSLLLTSLFSAKSLNALSFIASGLSIACIILTAGVALFPFILPSSIAPNLSLTVWDSVSSIKTLNIMFYVAIIMVPIILLYTVWCYHKMWGRVTEEHITKNAYSTY